MMNIGNFIFDNSKVFVIAELSANHNGSLEIAKETIAAAKRAGADAIKLQTYTPDTITLNSSREDFLIKDTIWKGKTLYDLYAEAYTPWEWHHELFREAKKHGLICFSSPFDHSAVDFLETLDVPAYKIASFEIADIPLIKYIASKKKPIIISTGIACETDIELAIDTCRKEGNDHIFLLQCTSSYPSEIKDANLETLKYFKQKYNVRVGVSDHTLGDIVPCASVALGAEIIEKHFILDRSIGGPDASFSMTELEFKLMVDRVRLTKSALGQIVSNKTKEKNKIFSRSLYVVKELKKGEIFTTNHVRSIRPGYGLHPKHFFEIIGTRARKNFEIGDRLTLEDLNVK